MLWKAEKNEALYCLRIEITRILEVYYVPLLTTELSALITAIMFDVVRKLEHLNSLKLYLVLENTVMSERTCALYTIG